MVVSVDDKPLPAVPVRSTILILRPESLNSDEVLVAILFLGILTWNLNLIGLAVLEVC